MYKMVVKFVNRYQQNFNKSNLRYILKNFNYQDIADIANHKTDFVLVEGNVHRSQYTHDNPQGYHWIKIKAFRNNSLVPHLSAVHIYVCFNIIHGCIIPYNYPGTDIANVEYMQGNRVPIGVSFGFNNNHCVFGEKLPKTLKNKAQKLGLKTMEKRNGKKVYKSREKLKNQVNDKLIKKYRKSK